MSTFLVLMTQQLVTSWSSGILVCSILLINGTNLLFHAIHLLAETDDK